MGICKSKSVHVSLWLTLTCTVFQGLVPQQQCSKLIHPYNNPSWGVMELWMQKSNWIGERLYINSMSYEASFKVQAHHLLKCPIQSYEQNVHWLPTKIFWQIKNFNLFKVGPEFWHQCFWKCPAAPVLLPICDIKWKKKINDTLLSMMSLSANLHIIMKANAPE
jgi:hypothetical protein